MKRFLTVAAVVAIALPCVMAAAKASLRVQVDPKSQLLVDSAGRVRVFHGVNAVYKEPPFIPSNGAFDVHTSMNAEDISNLAAWGFNLVRLGVMWRAVEPERGVVNTTYIKEVQALVGRLADAGIYTLIDLHQDSMANNFCGEGFPTWAVQPTRARSTPFMSFPAPLWFSIPNNKDGMPNLADCQKHSFSYYYVTLEANSAWQQLYDSAELRSAFAKHWNTVASAFADQKSVLGYELLNEPWPGDMYSKGVTHFLDGTADREHLAPLYEEAYAAVRRADDETIVFYEPAALDNDLRQTLPFATWGFRHGPGGRADDNKQAIAFHIYCTSLNSTGDPSSVERCMKPMSAVYRSNIADSKRIGGGLLMSEFGAVGKQQLSAKLIDAQLSMTEQSLTSWAYWTFKSFHDITTTNSETESFYNHDGSLQMDKVKALSRTYAPAIAGVPGSIDMSFDSSTAHFHLAFDVNMQAQAGTVVYINLSMWYPNGFRTVVKPEGAAKLVARDDGTLLHDVVPTPGSNNLKLEIDVYAL